MRRILLGLALLYSSASATVHYKLTPDPPARSILVSVTIDAPRATETFRIPAWCPGYYQIAQYQQKLYDIKATDEDGHSLEVQPVNTRGWKVFAGGRSELVFSYRVLGDDLGLGFFGVNVGSDKAFVNGSAAFMYVDGRLTEDVDLQIKDPDGWDIATTLTTASASRFTAGGYDEFVDCPIQLGAFTRKPFKVFGVPFEAIYVAPDNSVKCNMDAETERLRKVSIPALRMFGGASFKKYLYIIHLEIGNFSGGLEHRACNVQAVANSDELDLDDLAAHEYFHAWNVKQIRPLILGPFDYSGPQRTGNLWFAEGVTDYYAKLDTYASGLKDEAWLKNELCDQIKGLQGGQTRKVKTVEEASKTCWEWDGFGYGDLSFYEKGLLAGLLFDVAIIDATDGRKTLDDVMRLLYAKYRLPKPGYGEDDLRIAINTVAGKDLSDLYNRMIRSTAEMPYDELAKIGLVLKVSSPIPGGSSKAYSLEADPAASTTAKAHFAVWLHRLNAVVQKG